MADLNSWEDDPAAQDNDLARRTQQQLNMNNLPQQQQPGQASFHPGVASFQPTAHSFQPGQQFGGGGGGGAYMHPHAQQQQQQQPYYNQQQQQQYQQQPQQQQYQQPYYNQQGIYQQYGQGYGGGPAATGYQTGHNNTYDRQYGQYSQYGGPADQSQHMSQQAPPPQQQQQQQPQQAAAPTPTIIKRPIDSAASGPKPTMSTEGGAKVLTIGGDAPKPKAKILTIGATAPTPTEAEADQETKGDTAKPEPTAKVAAAKAIEKTGRASSPTSSGRSSPSAPASKPPIREIDAVEKEQEADVDEETLKELYPKEHCSVIFCGHVDAGKSTLGGSILYATGKIDSRTLEKYKRDAKEMGRETWWLSFALDLTDEERTSGKTIQTGRAFFETDKRRYSILDAPGHKTYVPEMIGGASQADIGIIVISARAGEWEAGFERGGQTREHAILLRTQGVNKLVVAINKLDSVNWSEERYEECRSKFSLFLKSLGYNLKTDVFCMPVSGQQVMGIKDRIPKGIADWYSGPSLLEYLDSMTALERKIKAPFVMSVNSKYRDLGTMVEGKIESGVVKKGMSLVMMPNKSAIDVATVYGETEEEMPIAQCGDQVRLRLKGVEEDEVMPGFVLCSPRRLVHCVRAFEAQIRILDLKSIITAGFNCVLHVHAAIEEVTFGALLHTLQKGTNRRSKRAPTHAKRGDSIIARMEVTSGSGSVCVEVFEEFPALGRFTLRDQGNTIAIGRVTKLILDD